MHDGVLSEANIQSLFKMEPVDTIQKNNRKEEKNDIESASIDRHTQ